MNYKLIATAAAGVEGVTKKELYALGCNNVTAINGKLYYEGDETLIAKSNLHLRTADKVLIVLFEKKVFTFDELFDAAISFPWEDILDKKGKYIVNGKSAKSKLFAESSIQSIIKKAIIERLTKAYKTSFFPENGTEYHIDFNFFEDTLTVSLNTSGAPLHKRGYRDLLGAAPLRETLAACMVLLSGWKGEKPLIDPFCGSGTIPIEAALIAMNIPAGFNRNFACENYSFLPSVMAEEKERAAEGILTGIPYKISGLDIDPAAIKLSLRHAKNAKTDNIHFQTQELTKLSSRFPVGTIITNPPYGERLLDKEKADELYRSLRKVYDGLSNWDLFLITTAQDFERTFGKRADRTRRLFNAKKECRLFQYISKQPAVTVNN